jgi:2-keto-3-deoxy-6-phosphogluconate aldolase
LFAKAGLNIIKFFSKWVSRKGNQFSGKEMHQRFSTQLLSPNASNKVIKILKHKEVANAPGLA